MKQFFALLLTLVLLLPLAACGRGEAPLPTQTAEKQDLSALDAAGLYAFARQKLEQLLNYSVKTSVTGGEAPLTVTMTRLRTGYDAFDLKRTGDGNEVTYAGGVAFVKTKLGSFTAEAAPRIMREFLEGNFYPLTGPEAALVTVKSREGLTLKYESKNEALLARFATLDPTGAFLPEGLEGELILNEEGVLLEEKMKLVGKSGEEAKTYTITTKMEKFRSVDNTVAPLTEEEKAAFVAVEDIRTPAMLHRARESLLKGEVLALTAVQSTLYKTEGLSLSYGVETNLYRKALSSYLSNQSLFSKTEGDALPAEVSRLYQYRLEKGILTAVEHDLFTAEELSRTEAESRDLLWQKELAELLPEAAELATLKLEKDGTSYHVEFTATETLAAALVQKAAASLGITADTAGATMKGTLTLDAETGAVVALSYSYKAGALTGSFTLTPDTEDFTVPSLQTPTPTTGTEEGEHGPEC